MKAEYTEIGRVKGWVITVTKEDVLEEAYLQFRGSRLTRYPIRSLPWGIFRRRRGKRGGPLLRWYLDGLDRDASVAEIGHRFRLWFGKPVKYNGMFVWLEMARSGSNPTELVIDRRYTPQIENDDVF